MSECDLCVFLAGAAICAVVICVCIFVIPKEDIVLVLVISVVSTISVCVVLLLYCFGCEVIKYCCQSKKKEPLLDSEKQQEDIENRERNMSSDDTFDRRIIKNNVVSWKEYTNTCES
jgi:hypothetical protein